ncbi:putative thyroid adenoma-associated protein-like isoform X1 [Apostichopus japonicus]|uniref:Putative thyroid adenoma-associated protein-like isoform X1 n=1 Tax=Stichopus japonicus TaxID=307972 RepID=A0A2G8JL54_STIJA|nr:putative thyroid adenoma-associated protein-like isoform X1 [Apostichopus japonicus]
MPIAQYLKKCQWNDSLDKDQEQLIVILADMYKAVEPKSANSRTIASILQSFPENLQEVIIKVMREQVQRDVSSFKLSEDAASMRRKLDFVSAHMENFPIGQTVIRECISEVLPFCHQCLGQIIDLTRNSVSVVKKTEFMNHCLACLKIVMSLAQKYSERLIKDIGVKVLSEVLEGVTDHSLQVLNDEMFSLDCRSAAGLTVALIAKLRLGEDDSLKQLLCLLGNNAGQKEKAVTMTTVTPSLHPLSRLFLLHGVLAMHSPSALLQKMIVDGTERVILTDVAFWELMNLSDRLTEASSSLCAARTIVQWGIVAKNSASCCEELKPSLRGSGVIAKQLMGYIWKRWDHPVDGIRHQCQSIFENLIETHIICQQGYSSEDPFMSNIFQTLMTSSWHVRCKYRLLVSMVPYFNVEKILVLHPTIARDLMMAMTEQSIAPYASELLEKLFKQHFQEVKDNSDKWCTVWIKPSLTILLSDSLQKQQERYLSQYFIPKVLKCNPPCLSFVVSSMDSCVTTVTHGCRRLNILIMWLKVARSVGVLNHGNQVTENESTQHMWKGIVTMTTLQEALSHRDNQIILDALGLLCDSKKTTEELSKDELELLQQCLPLHMTNQSAAFRQQLLAMMKKMLYRLKDSSKSFEKSVKESQKRGDIDGEALLKGKLNVYKSFLENLWDLLMEGLSPGYSYPQRTTSLLIITTVRSIFKGI